MPTIFDGKLAGKAPYRRTWWLPGIAAPRTAHEVDQTPARGDDGDCRCTGQIDSSSTTSRGERTRHDIVGLNYYDPYLADDRDDAQESSFALQTAGVIQGRDYLSGHIYDHHRIPVAKST